MQLMLLAICGLVLEAGFIGLLVKIIYDCKQLELADKRSSSEHINE